MYKIEFKTNEKLVEELNLGLLTIDDSYQLNESIDSSQRSSLSSISLSLPHTPIKTPQDQFKSNNKSNLELVKEQGIWRGGDSLEFWCPSGIAVDAKNDYLIISDSWNHRIQVRNLQNLDPIHTIQSNDIEFNSPRDVCLDSLNRLVISDSGNNRIKFYNVENFTYIDSFGKRGFNKGEFIQPIGLAIDEKNQIYVCDRGNCRIQVFDSNGKYLQEWGSRGGSAGQFEYPEYLCISPNNHLLVSDTGNHRIQIFDLDSFDVLSPKFASYISSFGRHGDDPGCFRLPRGITTDSDGFIMVADYKNDRLQLFEPNGKFVKEINESCSEELNFPVYFDKPVAIATTPNGGLVVTEWGRSHKLQIF
jgi:tripartite motif-containing protein 71